MGLKDWAIKKALTGKLPLWIYSLIGKKLSKVLNLKEGNMAEEEKKPWYKSKGVLTGVVTVLIAAYNAAVGQFSIPAIPEWVYVLLGALGIYSRVVADKKIG